MKRRTLLAAPAALLPFAVRAQTFPDRPVRLVVPWGPGGNVDTTARLLQPAMTRELGQQVIVDNRAGAGGTVGANAMARAQPDGLTLLVGSNGPITINPLIMRDVPYDPLRAFAPVGLIARIQTVLVVGNSLPARDLAEFVRHARERSGRLTAGSAGIGTVNHLLIELFNEATGANLTHVPFRMSGGGLAELTAGSLACSFDQVSTALAQARDGRVRILGVAARERLPGLPEVPTFAEVGLPEVAMDGWNGLLAPAGTPEKIVGTLAAALRAALADTATRERIDGFGALPASAEAATPAALGEIMRREAMVARRVVERAQIRLD